MTTIKGKMDVRFPANVAVQNFLTITKSNGTYTFGVDYTLLGPGTVSDPTTTILTALDQTAGIYKQITLTDLQAPSLVSPAFTGIPTAPTASPLNNSTQISTTSYVDAADTAVLGTVNAALALKADLASPTLSGVPAAPTASVGTNTTQIATTAFVIANGASAGVSSYNTRTGAVVATGTDVPLRSYLSGLTLSTAGSSATFGIAAGVATDSTNVSMMALASAYTKTTSAWALGTAAGSLDTGAIAASTGYHVYLIQRPDTRVVDVLISLSASAPTMPTNYTLFRRIGWMETNGSSQWILFSQNGDEFLWSTPVTDVNTSTLGTTATLFALSVPLGINVTALYRMIMLNATVNAGVLLNSPDEASTSSNSPTGNRSISNQVAGVNASGVFATRTNTSAQIRAIASLASTTLQIATYGWIDRRGKD